MVNTTIDLLEARRRMERLMENPYNNPHEIKKCKRCGRRLRGAESKQRGYGKICWEKSQSEDKPLFRISDKGVAQA